MTWYFLGEKSPKKGEVVLVLDELAEQLVEAEYDDMSFFHNTQGHQLQAYYWRQTT